MPQLGLNAQKSANAQKTAGCNVRFSACNTATRLQRCITVQFSLSDPVQRNATHPFRGVAVLHGAGRRCIGSSSQRAFFRTLADSHPACRNLQAPRRVGRAREVRPSNHHRADAT